MSPRTFYKTTYVIEVLSESPIPAEMDLKDVLAEAETGSYSSDVKSQETVEVDGATMAKLLEGQRSDCEFFRLDEKGNNLDDEEDDGLLDPAGDDGYDRDYEDKP